MNKFNRFSTVQQHLLEIQIYYSIINVFIVTFDQFNVSLIIQIINILENSYCRKVLKSSVC